MKYKSNQQLASRALNNANAFRAPLISKPNAPAELIATDLRRLRRALLI